MTVTATSIEAYHEANQFSVEEAAVLGYVEKLGPISTKRLIKHLVKELNVSEDDRYDLNQQVTARMSMLKKHGEIIVQGDELSDKGKRIECYVINRGVKVYHPSQLELAKERIEELEKQLRDLPRIQRELDQYKADSVKKDDVADAYYQARESGDYTSITKLFVRG